MGIFHLASYINMEEKQHLLPQVSAVKATNTFWNSVFTLTNTILGSGTLALPYAISCSGWLLGNIVMVIIAFITQYSVQVLMKASVLAGPDVGKTYEALGYHSCGKWGARLAEFTFIFGGFGTLVSYFIFISHLFGQVFGVSTDKTWIISVIITTFVVLPLSLSRKITKLRFTAIFATFSVAYIVLFMTGVYMFTNAAENPVVQKEVYAINFSSSSVYTFTLLVSAFCCHNTALPVFEALKDRSLKKMSKAVCVALTITFFLYEIIAICGYSTFGSATKDNILLNFEPEFIVDHSNVRYPLLASQLFMAVALTLTCPIALWPFRSALLSLYLRVKHKQQLTSNHASNMEFISVTVVTEICILIVSIILPSVKVPLSIVGSVSGSLIIFIMPSLFYLKLQDASIYAKQNLGPLCLFISGIFVGILSFSMTMYKIYHEYFA